MTLKAILFEMVKVVREGSISIPFVSKGSRQNRKNKCEIFHDWESIEWNIPFIIRTVYLPARGYHKGCIIKIIHITWIL